MSERLKDCPFCGGKAKMCIGKYPSGKDWVFPACEDCEALAYKVSEWNHRVGQKERKIEKISICPKCHTEQK